MTQLLMRLPSLADLPDVTLAEGYSIRLYRPLDRDETAAVLQRAFPEFDWAPDRFDRALPHAPDVKATYVVENGGSVVGTASARIHPDRFHGSGYVHWVAADPGHRGRRIGLAATVEVLRYFSCAGLRDAILETDDERLAALRLYLGLGFVPEYAGDDHRLRWSVVFRRLGAAGRTSGSVHANHLTVDPEL